MTRPLCVPGEAVPIRSQGLVARRSGFDLTETLAFERRRKGRVLHMQTWSRALNHR
ncbi:hypothetical protein [Segeticoccus rhizosphaerae]|jgi:hypothetical protein|uniref:hypothetical protein n=1 Tax=Segeticoccus rhizosphaerae TaxID=1104777 RepID=UPI0013900289|nr:MULTISPECIES: hypothetical protein [Intrasporangiaceae]